MQILSFKTNINCGGCVARVANALNQMVGEENWAVDTLMPEKILTVKTENITSQEIVDTIKSIGFKIETL